jgi:hypothetical protein
MYMNSKPITYGAIGFVSGVVLVLLIGLIGMSGMMWGRGRMMDGWFGGRYNNCNYPQLPQNPGSTQ